MRTSYYSSEGGVRRPSLFRRILSRSFTALAIAGWFIAVLFFASVVFGFFDEILIFIWEGFYGA